MAASQLKLLRTAISAPLRPNELPEVMLNIDLPRRRNHSQRPDAIALSQLLFPDYSAEKSLIHYEILRKQVAAALTQYRLEKHQQQGKKAREANRMPLQEPWEGQVLDPLDLNGPRALPMPVKIGTSNDFKDCFYFLETNTDPKAYIYSSDLEDASKFNMRVGKELLWNTPMVEFKRGVIYEDGRLDLCKMVVGPTHIERLLDSLENNTVVTQFLLGNNVISATGARRIAKFISDHQERIETWYLAGNHIKFLGFKALVDSMVNSPKITNVWLKRNPLSPDAVDDLFRLITQTPHLRTLDIENTELGNDGVARLFAQLKDRHDIPLRNIYLNANGIGEKACAELAAFIASPSCKLESLFLGSNPIGDDGAAHLASALRTNQSLFRIAIASTGLTSTGVAAIADSLVHHPRLMSLDVGFTPTTLAHNQRFNHISDSAVPSLCKLVTQNPHLRSLDLGHTALSIEGLATVRDAVASSTLCAFDVYRISSPEPINENTLQVEAPAAPTCSLAVRRALEANVATFYPEMSYKSFSGSLQLRLIRNCADVRLIDSVYRTRDQRNPNKSEIQQYWTPGDPVWKLVEEDV